MADDAQPPHFITKLANELLSEIFLAYLELNYDTPLAQLLLTHVCHSWRDTALNSTPRLWTVLYMSFGLNFSDFDHQSMITTWLHRSILPVDVRIEQKQPLERLEPRRRVPRGVVKAVVSVSSRIRNLKIEGSGTSWTPLISLPSGSFPILTILDLTIERDWERGSYPETFAVFEKSPLRKLKWCWGSMICMDDFFFDKFSFDSTHVTSLSLVDTSSIIPETSWNLLAGFPNVVDCTLFLGDYQFNYDNMVQQLTFPNLTAFTLKNDFEATLVASNALTLINAPSLTELHLEFLVHNTWGENPNNPLAPILAGFSQRFHLTHLSLIHADFILPEELLVIINAFSSLHSFTFIARTVLPKTFLQSLICKKKDEQPVLPYLEYLRFGRYNMGNSNSLQPRQLLEVVESRWMEEKMKCFHIHSRLMKVQIDRVIDLTPDNDKDPLPSRSEAPLNTSSFKLDPQDEWLAGFNAAENSRLQRLQAEGFIIAEDTLYVEI